MKNGKSIVFVLNIIVCFVLMVDIAYADIDDEVSTTPLELGFEITTQGTKIEQSSASGGLSYELLSSSEQAYVYYHRNLNQNLTAFDGLYFDVQNKSIAELSLILTLSPGVGAVYDGTPTTEAGKITYADQDQSSSNFFDDEFWHKDEHGGDGHYENVVEDDDDSESENDSTETNTPAVGIISEYSYFLTKSGDTYFSAQTSHDGVLIIPAGFDGRIYVPFFSMGYSSNVANDLFLNNISAIGFTVLTKVDLTQNFIIKSYGKYNYSQNNLLEEAKTASITGGYELSIPSVGVSSTIQKVKNVPENIDYRYELVTNDNYIKIQNLEEETIIAYPRASDGSFDIRVWLNDVVCLQKTVVCTKSTEGINSIISEGYISDTAYVNFYIYMGQLIEFYRPYFFIIPVVFGAIVLLILNANKEKKETKDGGAN